MSQNNQDGYLAIHLQSIGKQLDAVGSRLSQCFNKIDEMNGVLQRNSEIVDQADKKNEKIVISMEGFQSEIRRAMQDTESRLSDVEKKVDIKLTSFEKDIKYIKDELEPIKKHVGTVQKLTGFFTTSSGMLKFIGVLLTTILGVRGVIAFIAEFTSK